MDRCMWIAVAIVRFVAFIFRLREYLLLCTFFSAPRYLLLLCLFLKNIAFWYSSICFKRSGIFSYMRWCWMLKLHNAKSHSTALQLRIRESDYLRCTMSVSLIAEVQSFSSSNFSVPVFFTFILFHLWL